MILASDHSAGLRSRKRLRDRRRRFRSRATSLIAAIAFAVLALATSIASAEPTIWEHNDSRVALYRDGARVVFRYLAPKPDIAKLGVTRGTLLFDGLRAGSVISGTAHVFSSRCGALPYPVAGEVSANHTESDRIGAIAERLVMQVPEVHTVGRRTGRAELDEHAEGDDRAGVDGLGPTSYNAGGSVVLALTRRTNLLFEAVHEWTESVAPGRVLEREKVLTVLPGVRHAVNLQDAQLVMGVGAPITFVEDKREYGVFFYLSYEHKFLK